MGTRKSMAALSADEKARFVAAILQLKANGVYDRYVRQHRDLFTLGIHRTSIFLPWHREFLRRLERDLQAVDPSVNLPYWDWTEDRSTGAPLWSDDFMGGDGESGSGRVTSGPFAFNTGQWDLTVTDSSDAGPALRRNLGGGILPSALLVDNILTRVPYASFAPALETRIHNRVHVWIGGSAATASSPNDPAFFLLHCNVDRLWAVWQAQHPNEAFYQSDGFGRGINDPLMPWAEELNPPTPGSLLDHTALGYTYDTDIVDSPDQITDLPIGAPAQPADIGAAGEMDWYRFIVAAAGTYIMETEGSTDVVMTLFGPNSQTAQVTEDDDSGQSRNARIVSNLTAGTYFLRVRHYQPTSTGLYRISVKGEQPQTPIPEIQVDGPAVQGNIEAANESDIYRFTAPVTGLYTIQTEGNTDTFLSLFGPNSQTVLITQNDDSGAGLNSRIVADLVAGVYFARVRHYSPIGTGAYTIGVRR